MRPIKVVVSGYIGFDNFGDESILTVLLDNLKRQSTQITVISANPQKTKLVHGVKTCKTFDLLAIIFALINCDILISGGGSLLQDKTSLKSLLYYLFIIFSAKFFGKKVIIFAQGIGPLKHPIAKFLTKQILKSCDLHSVRDEKSLFLLRGWGIKTELQSDPVFNLEIPPYTPQKKLGIQLRSWTGLNEEFLGKLADKITSQFPNHDILLFSFQDTLDLEICQKFQAKLAIRTPQRKIEIIQNNFPQNIANNFKNLEYLVAMRFHACLLALKFGIKTLAISYDEKVEKLAKTANIPCIILENSTDSIEKTFEKEFEKLSTLKESEILKFSNSQKYDFSKINELIKQLETKN